MLKKVISRTDVSDSSALDELAQWGISFLPTFNWKTSTMLEEEILEYLMCQTIYRAVELRKS